MPSEPVLGVPLALADYDGTLAWVDAAVAAHHRGSACHGSRQQEGARRSGLHEH